MRAPPTIETVRDILGRHARELGDRKVRSLAMFGSVARHEAHEESDLDLLVEFDEARKPSLFDLIGLEQYLEDVFGRDVDLVERSTLKPAVRRRADRDAVQVF